MDRISLSIYDAVEVWYQKEGELGHGKQAWIRKAIYYSYLTGHYPKELFSAIKPKISFVHHKIGVDVMRFVKLEADAAGRHSKPQGIKTFTIPVFLDSKIDRETKTALFVEEQMWEVLTDSWAYDPSTLDSHGIGNNPVKMLEARMKKVMVKAHTPQIKDVPLRPSDLRSLRIYDLLVNRTEYFGIGGPMAVKSILGLADMQWLMKSDIWRYAYATSDIGDIAAMMKKYTDA